MGHGLQNATDTWAARVSSFVAAAFPSANVTFRNGALGGTDSSYMALCLDTRVGVGTWAASVLFGWQAGGRCMWVWAQLDDCSFPPTPYLQAQRSRRRS